MRTMIFFCALLKCALVTAAGVQGAAPDLQGGYFDVATPVWAEGRAREMNDSLAFKSVFRSRAGEAATLTLTGSTVYRVRLNGKFVGYGPARGPKGMFPMCYPADHRSGRYIPNWAMWLVLELDDYLKRGGKRGLVDRFRPRMMALKKFFDGYRNADGLLERLPSWVFVEWSHSNALVQDVNYPSNMLWAEALDCLDRLYGVPEFAAEALRIRSQVRRQSWKDSWFCDNAVRDSNGKLVLSGECTETCQYYAFFTGTATQKTHPDLWRRLVEEFGPDRKAKGLYPEIWPSNAFIGNFLRLELLSRAKLQDQVEKEIKGYFLGMAERTGTLWEHDSPKASCCHGFASYVAALIAKTCL